MTEAARDAGPAAAAALFAGPGEVRALGATLDWGATPLGWPDAWSPALRIATRAMLDAPFPVCLWAGPEYALVYNDAYRRILAAKHPAALGQPGSVVWAEIWEGLAPQFAQVRAGGPPVLGEDAHFVMARLEGGGTEDAWFSYSLSALRDEDGSVAAVLNISPETTARVLAERALAVERTRLATVFAQSPSFLAVLRGPEHVFVNVNAAYTRLVGGRDVVGKPVLDALPELRGQGFTQLLDRVVATGEPFVGRETAIQLGGVAERAAEERYLDFQYLPYVEADESGVPRTVGVIAHGVDVTEQVRARREVERLLGESERARGQAEQARAQADEANQAKSAFLATMSHELRTPINAMLGYTQLLDLGLAGPLTEQQRAYLERLAGSSRHLLGLVNDVLDLSKIEAGETRVAHRDAVTGPPVRAALDLVRPQAAAKGVKLVDARADEQGVSFVGDEDRVRQIVVNLLSNAVKFTPAGGTVTVSCDAAPEAAAPVGGGREGAGPWTYVEVADTGVGIALEEQSRIFDPFHQVEGGHTRTAGGTGLGLAISRRLARLMGGDLLVESAPGAGATFTLWLPAARPADGAPAEHAPAREARAGRDGVLRQAPGLGTVGALLRTAIDDVLAAYTDRLRADPAVPRARDLRRIELENHQGSFLADLAQSLVIVDESGRVADEELRDGSAIQRVIAEAHGARRFAQGFDEAALRRDRQLFREEVERAVRERLRAGRPAADEAVQVLVRLVDRAEAISLAGWRRAASAVD